MKALVSNEYTHEEVDLFESILKSVGNVVRGPHKKNRILYWCLITPYMTVDNRIQVNINYAEALWGIYVEPKDCMSMGALIYEVPFENLPLFMGKGDLAQAIVRWRLELGK